MKFVRIVLNTTTEGKVTGDEYGYWEGNPAQATVEFPFTPQNQNLPIPVPGGNNQVQWTFDEPPAHVSMTGIDLYSDAGKTQPASPSWLDGVDVDENLLALKIDVDKLPAEEETYYYTLKFDIGHTAEQWDPSLLIKPTSGTGTKFEKIKKLLSVLWQRLKSW